MSNFPNYVVLAQNTLTDECDWRVFTGASAEQAARHLVGRWGAREGWVAYLRTVGDIEHSEVGPRA
jgi:hypothetical protein